MLEFRDITENDVGLIREYVSRYGGESCDFTLCGIYLWGIYYSYKIAFFRNTMFIKGIDESGRDAFALPIGEMNSEDAIAMLRDYCKARNTEARFSFVPESALGAFGDAYRLKLVDWSDYVYSAESFSTLSGKKLHKKKNRFNKFIKAFENYEFEEISGDNIQRLAEFYREFVKENPATDNRASAEEKIIEKLLREYASLSLLGGVLSVNGKIIAFAIGDRVGDTLFMHFEKALRDFDGAYEAMNVFFARQFSGDALWVNREEDMGDEGLRRAKTAYCPVKMIDKYEVVL